MVCPWQDLKCVIIIVVFVVIASCIACHIWRGSEVVVLRVSMWKRVTFLFHNKLSGWYHIIEQMISLTNLSCLQKEMTYNVILSFYFCTFLFKLDLSLLLDLPWTYRPLTGKKKKRDRNSLLTVLLVEGTSKNAIWNCKDLFNVNVKHTYSIHTQT